MGDAPGQAYDSGAPERVTQGDEVVHHDGDVVAALLDALDRVQHGRLPGSGNAALPAWFEEREQLAIKI